MSLNYFRDTKSFAWNGRRRMTYGHQNNCIPEEGSEASTEEYLEVYKSRSKIPISGNMQKGKSVSRSSSGIGTSSRQSSKKKEGSDNTSSRGFSPPGKTDYFDEESDGDVQPLNSLRNGKRDETKKVTPLQENKYSTLKSLKKPLICISMLKIVFQAGYLYVCTWHLCWQLCDELIF